MEMLDSEIIPCPAIAFNARTQIRDAVTGKNIDSGGDDASRRLVQTLRTLGGPVNVPAETLARWIKHAGSGDFDAFQHDATSTLLPGDITKVWTDAVAVAQARGQTSGEFIVEIPKVVLPNSSDHFTVLDDGQSTTLSINHAANILQDRLFARLKVQLQDRWLYLSNDNVIVGPYGRTATFTFPSVKKTLTSDASCLDPTPPSTQARIQSIIKPDKKLKKRPTKKANGNDSVAQKEVTPPKHVPCPMQNVYAEVVYDRGLRSWQTMAPRPGDPHGGDTFVYQWYPTFSPLVDCASGTVRPATPCKTPPQSVPLDVMAARQAGIIEDDEIPIPYFVTAKADPTTPDFTMSLTAHQILAAHDGTGEVVVAIHNNPKKTPEIHIRITEGAFIDSVTADPTTLAVKIAGPDRVVGEGLYKLRLKGLVPGSRITVHAFQPSPSGGEIAVADESAYVVSTTERETTHPRS
jgi:hypothetical protein